MIKSVHIKNFKSVVDLKIDLGQFNVLIGENGAGKSNILEAIGFGAAASADKLDFEFLGSRGIRLAEYESMISAFNDLKENKKINILFEEKKTKNIYDYSLIYTENNKWINEEKDIKGTRIKRALENLVFSEDRTEKIKTLYDKNEDSNSKVKELDKAVGNLIKLFDFNIKSNDDKEKFKLIFDAFLEDKFSNESISNFIVYSPEHSSMRKLEDTSQIYPLGVKGEGIFQYLKKLNTSNNEDKKLLSEIKNNMMLLDWYEDFKISENELKSELSISIKDRFLKEDLKYFDQRSTNEGFLFLLFYSILFCSSDTPTFFAIDNIDTSLNPKLSMQLIENLSALAKKHKKQVIVTTHSPAVLDGLNLKDSSQRLFVVKRNDDGFTTAKRIEHKSDRKMRLSEIWTSGFIGGLPENF